MRPLLSLFLLLCCSASADWTGPGYLTGINPCPQLALMVDADARSALGPAGLKVLQSSLETSAADISSAVGFGLGKPSVSPAPKLPPGCGPVIVDVDFSPVADGYIQAFVITTNVFKLPRPASIPWQKLSFGAYDVDSSDGRLLGRMIAQRAQGHLAQMLEAWRSDALK